MKWKKKQNRRSRDLLGGKRKEDSFSESLPMYHMLINNIMNFKCSIMLYKGKYVCKKNQLCFFQPK